MHIAATELPEVHVITLERFGDERGYFARTFCQQEFAAARLDSVVAQCNFSQNRRRGTLRGVHFQFPPAAEAKLVRCVRGAIWDVAVDLRPASPTFCRWVARELSADNDQMLYVPKGFGHGFQTLTDDAEVSYQMSAFYTPELAGSVRWNDPLLRIAWPLPVTSISVKDKECPDRKLGYFDPLSALLPLLGTQ